MTHPLSKGWNQPNRENFIFVKTNNEEFVLMNEKTFNSLSNYEISNPSALYERKIWRRGTILVYCTKDDNPEFVKLIYTRIAIIQGKKNIECNEKNISKKSLWVRFLSIFS